MVIASEDPRVRSWVAAALGPAWGVTEAADGLEARRIVAREQPDLLVADETMEHYGAFGLSRDLKMGASPPAIIVLLERAQDTWLANWSGADRWFVRPVDPFALADAARELTAEPAKAKKPAGHENAIKGGTA